MTTPTPEELVELAARVDTLKKPDRALDAEIAEVAYGWKRTLIGPDYDGENACEILTQDGQLIKGFAYPPRGKIPVWYHVPEHTRDPRDSLVPRNFIRQQTAQALRDMAKGIEARASQENSRG